MLVCARCKRLPVIVACHRCQAHRARARLTHRYELATGKLPFHNKEFAHAMALSDYVIAGGRPDDVPSSTPLRFRTIMECCWSTDAAARPTFQALVSASTSSLLPMKAGLYMLAGGHSPMAAGPKQVVNTDIDPLR
jgi:hypothetical protein